MKSVKGLIVASVVTLLCTGCVGKVSVDENMESGQQILSAGSVESESTKVQEEEPTDMPGEEGKEEKTTELPGGEESENNNDIPEKWKIPELPEPTVLSEDEMERVDKVIRAYYCDNDNAYFHFNLIGYEQIANEKIRGAFDEEEYSYAEVVAFDVLLENVEPDRHIIIGSKDGWENCTVLNEGY